ncbi:MAG TPA: ATP-binding protein [Steroidobacteraceae bacterium]
MTASQRAEDKNDQVAVGTRLSLEREISALRAEKAQLLEQLALRDHALDATSTHFVIVQFSSQEPLVVYCNKVVAEQHELRREDVIGKPIGILTRSVARINTMTQEVSAALRAGHSYSIEDEVTRQDGSTFWIGLSIRPLFDAAGHMTHAVAVGADITVKREERLKKQELQDKLLAQMKERERMALELQLAQKLESVGQLAAGIAHEINTPIQYVGDSLHFLRSAYEDLNQLLTVLRESVDALLSMHNNTAVRTKLDELNERLDIDFIRAEIPKAFSRTFDGVERVTNIVRAMKEFAHPDANEQSTADLNHAIETTLLVAANVYKYAATVSTQFGELPPVTCNVGELNQVFLNLIVNAAHAIQDSGKDVGSGEITISTALAGDEVEIRIRDNGCGVPQENLSRIYDPFFTTKEVGRGTGQGLAITHSIIVDKHGGAIGVSSGVGKGTEFTLRLPVKGRQAVKA